MRIFTRKDGKKVTLLNPKEKADKFALELNGGVRQTNAGDIKYDDFGNPLRLSEKESAYRAGYIAAHKDSARAYYSRMNKKS